MRGKITKRSVEALKPGASDVFLWEGGFGVKVTPKGRRIFVVQYFAPGMHRVTRRYKIGEFGRPWTVDAARSEARRVLGRVEAGEDPARDKREDRRAAREDTVEALFAEYIEHGRGQWKPRTVDFFDSLGRLYILPALGRLPISRVTVRDVGRLHHDMRTKPITANRAVQLVRGFYNWLERRDLFDGRNPARRVEMFREQGRERFLTRAEMARLGEALRVAGETGLPPAPEHKKAPSHARKRNAGMFTSKIIPANPTIVAAIRFLLLTGFREREALTLKWADVDLTSGTVTLADTKTGRSVRMIGAPAVEVINAQPRIEGSPYVFPGRPREPSADRQPLREIGRVWHAVRHSAGLRDVRLHDIRHSVASFAGGQGYSLFLIQHLLGHRSVRSTERYAHLADDARKSMADDVSAIMRDALAAPATAEPATPITRRKRHAS